MQEEIRLYYVEFSVPGEFQFVRVARFTAAEAERRALKLHKQRHLTNKKYLSYAVETRDEIFDFVVERSKTSNSLKQNAKKLFDDPHFVNLST